MSEFKTAEFREFLVNRINKYKNQSEAEAEDRQYCSDGSYCIITATKMWECEKILLQLDNLLNGKTDSVKKIDYSINTIQNFTVGDITEKVKKISFVEEVFIHENKPEMGSCTITITRKGGYIPTEKDYITVDKYLYNIKPVVKTSISKDGIIYSIPQ